MLWFYSPPKGKYGHFHRLLGMIFKLSTLEVLNAIAALENEKHVLELKHNTPSPVHFLLYLSCKLSKSLFMKAFLPQLSHNITFNALHQLPPPNVFLWSAPEPCSPLGKWLDWVPPKRYQDTTHTTQHRWDQLLLLNHSWIVTETWSRIFEQILDSCGGPGGLIGISSCLFWSKSFSVLKKSRGWLRRQSPCYV